MKKSIRILAACLALVFAFSLGSMATFAQEGEDDEVTTTQADDGSSTRGEKLKLRLQEFKQKRAENRQQRLAANKLRVCEQRQTRIKAIMNRAITRAERQLKLFETIAERVKAFYVEKGYNLANYDELVAAVDAAKAEAEANLATLKELPPFECDADDPKGNAEMFKLAMQSVREDLKGYRTAIKNLIVGVKSAHNTATDQTEEGGAE